ncbi:hypothetical protein D3C85_1116050 [compost metagenome]
MRGHHINSLGDRQQLGRVQVLADQMNPWMLTQSRQVEMTLLAPGHHVRVNLDHHRTLRMTGQRGIEHAFKIGGGGALQRCIAARLIGHQHTRLRQIASLDTDAIVFGHALLTPTGLQGTGTQVLRFGQRNRDQLFEARRGAGIVINAQRVDHQRQRRLIGTQAHGTQKTVFHREQWQTGLDCSCLSTQGAGLAAPRKDFIGLANVTHRSTQQPVFGQQGGEGSNLLCTLRQNQQRATRWSDIVHKKQWISVTGALVCQARIDANLTEMLSRTCRR